MPTADPWPATARVLRRRRWRRRGAKLAGVAGLLAVGYFAARWTTPTTPPSDDGPRPAIMANQPPADAPGPPSYDGEPPGRIERMAGIVSDADRRATLYRLAGDRYLERGDDLAALRCYRRALSDASADDLEIKAQRDSWMMMTLKAAKRKEMTDARQ